MKSEKKYYIGLDVGTNSVGWAVTEEFYNILRAKGKDLWGVRLFEKADTAATQEYLEVVEEETTEKVCVFKF